MTTMQDAIELELPATGSIYPKCMPIMMNRIIKPQSNKLKTLFVAYMVSLTLPMVFLFYYSKVLIDYLEGTPLTKALYISYILLISIFFLVLLYLFLRQKLIQNLLFKTTQFTQISHFHANKKGFSLFYPSSELSWSGTWKSVVEIAQLQEHIILNLGVNLIVIPDTVFANELETQKVLEILNIWHTKYQA